MTWDTSLSTAAPTAGTDREAPYTMVRRTCRELMGLGSVAAAATGNTKDETWTLPVRIDASAIDTFRKSIEDDVLRIQEFGTSLAQNANYTGLAFDFPTPDCEAAWIVVLHAVDFGSGWRRALHRHHGKGAWLTIKPGVVALFRMAQEADGGGATHLPAAWLLSLTHNQVAQAFGLQDIQEQNDSLHTLVEYLVLVLHDLGRGVEKEKCISLQEFVQKTLAAQSQSSTPAGDFVWTLVDMFPTTFNDRYLVREGTEEVCFFKKAQLVTGELFHRFRQEDKRFQFVDGDQLTAYIDNVIVATLRYKQIILPTEALTAMIETGQEIPMGSLEEVSLRAAALCAVDDIVKGIPALKSSSELGNYLWAGLGKEPEVRKFERHATKTIFY